MIPIFLCWGSFLNMLAYRLIHDVDLLKKRSFCPKCNQTIAWYDNIPIISWIILKSKCRSCKKPISILYPFIELISLIIFTLLFYKMPYPYIISYFIFFSALIITIRTDLETLLISQFVTIFLIPVAFISSLSKWLPLTIWQSIMGALFGYLLLLIINKTYFFITKKQGMGQGDIELLSTIGAFTGITGCWVSLLIGSILGSIVGILLIIFKKIDLTNKLPFGPFLALGAIIYVLYHDFIFQILLIKN